MKFNFLLEKSNNSVHQAKKPYPMRVQRWGEYTHHSEKIK